LRFVFLPSGEDPDTIIKRYGRPTWDDLVQQPLGLFDVMWQRATGQFDATNPTPEMQAQLSHMLHDQLSHIKDNVLRHAYAQALKQKLYEWGRQKQIPNQAFGESRKPWQPQANGNKRFLPPRAGNTNSVLRPPTMRQTQGQMLAKTWLATILNHPWALGQFADWFAAIPMPDPTWANLRTALLAWWQDIGQNNPDDGDKTLTAQDLEPYLGVNEFEALSAVFLSPATYLHAMFARKGTAMADVQNGLQEMVALAQQAGLTQDLQQWRQTMGTEPSATEWDRLIALSQAAAPNAVDNDE
jgi:DNA primase